MPQRLQRPRRPQRLQRPQSARRPTLRVLKPEAMTSEGLKDIRNVTMEGVSLMVSREDTEGSLPLSMENLSRVN